MKSKEVNNINNEIEWLTADEVAKHLKISKKVVYNLTSSRAIPYYKLGSRLRFSKTEIDEYLLRHRVSLEDL